MTIANPERRAALRNAHSRIVSMWQNEYSANLEEIMRESGVQALMDIPEKESEAMRFLAAVRADIAMADAGIPWV